MNNKGFIFIETVVTVVILSASLLILYNTYSSSFENEKDRLNYDDVAFIYRTNEIRKFLNENTLIKQLKSTAFENTYATFVGSSNLSLFSPEQQSQGIPSTLESIMNLMHINKILLLKTDYINNCYDELDICKTSVKFLTDNFKGYLKSLNDTDYDFYLVVEFGETIDEYGKIVKCSPDFDKNCNTYYANLGI